MPASSQLFRAPFLPPLRPAAGRQAGLSGELFSSRGYETNETSGRRPHVGVRLPKPAAGVKTALTPFGDLQRTA